MRRILWIAFSALFAVFLTAVAYQNNTTTHAGANRYNGSASDASRYRDLKLH